MALNLLRNARLFVAYQDIAEATFTATISGTTMTVSAVKQGTIVLNRTITGSGITAGTTITAFGLGSTGGVGTYTISNSHTIGTGTTITSGVVSTKTNTWEIPVLGDFSFSQPTETQDITVSEAGLTPTRGTARFNTALNPVEWSFTSYMRTYINGDSPVEARSLDRILWHGLLSSTTPSGWATSPFSTSTTNFSIDFSASNKHAFTPLYMYIKADNTWYKINYGQVNQAEIDFSIDSIGQIAWSGFGKNLVEASIPVFTSTTASMPREYSSPVVVTGNTVSATGSLADFIVQKYTTLYITGRNNISSATNQSYSIPITGGSLIINNNMTYLTPENLGIVNKPYAPITGTRDISGSLTCYLKTGDTNDTSDLLNELLSNTTVTQNAYEISFRAGGNSIPYVSFTGINAMLSIPTIDVQDVLSMNMDFKFMPYTETATSVTTGSNLTSGKVYQITTLGSGFSWTALGVPAATVATSLVAGKKYIILTTGTTDFTLVGASSNTVGTVFVATKAGTGDGTCYQAYFVKNSSTTSYTAGSPGQVVERATDLEQTSPNDLVITYYPSTTTTDTNDTN